MGMPSEWGEYEYRVVSCEMVTPVIAELWLTPLDKPVDYRPGQYVLLSDTAFRVPQRSYSVANAPRPDGQVSILVTLVEGGVTSTWATRLQPHDDVLLEGPFGTFVPAPAGQQPVLLLGAGSGLAPLRALAEALLDPAYPEGAAGRAVTLFFSGRTDEHTIDRARFEKWQERFKQFEYLLTCTRDATARRHGRIPALLAREFDNLADTEVFTSGPSGFVAGCEVAARALGATASDIHTEEFFVDPTPWSDTMPARPTRQ